jgi:hypothetical protein
VPLIPALRRLRQEDHEDKATLGYVVRPCHKQHPEQQKTTTYNKNTKKETMSQKNSFLL